MTAIMSTLGWLVRKMIRVALDLSVILVVLTLLPGIPPHIKFTTFEELEPMLPLEGALAKNNLLDDVERVLDGKIVAPESIATRKPEEIFVSLHGGKILRIWGPRYDHFKVAASIGPGCDVPWEEEVCGRPLGLRFATDGRLLVADSYLGLFAIDVDTGEKEVLFDIAQEIEGEVPLLADDLDEDNEGYIYWSDASSNAPLYKALIEVLASPSGRLIRFDPKTKTNKVLVRDLHFANGVQLSPDEQFVLVVETLKRRVWRHWLRGSKAGKTDIFVDRLPGSPDNIRSNGKGGYFVSIVTIFPESDENILRVLGKLPLLRKLVIRVMYLTHLFLNALGKLDSSRFIEKTSHQIFSFLPLAARNLRHSNLSLVVELDGEGKIIGSLQGHSGQLVQVSEAQRVGDYMFFGSPFNSYLGKLYVGEPPSMEVEGKGVRMKTVDEVKEEAKASKVHELKKVTKDKKQEISPKPGKDKEKQQQQQQAGTADRQKKKDEL